MYKRRNGDGQQQVVLDLYSPVEYGKNFHPKIADRALNALKISREISRNRYTPENSSFDKRLSGIAQSIESQ